MIAKFPLSIVIAMDTQQEGLINPCHYKVW